MKIMDWENFLMLICLEEQFQIRKNKFILSITLLDSSLKKKIGLQTQNQTNNQEWFEERRKRLTAFNFGKICKMPIMSQKIVQN